jgi:glycosyltransferase involved in cell wall biosynthesis
MKVVISCSGKFHAFALAEQMEKAGYLGGFYTTFYSKKNVFFRKFVSRTDTEEISIQATITNILLAILIKGFPRFSFFWNDLFDRWVAHKLKRNPNFDLFIGWSGMSMHSIRQVKKMGKIAIVERGSSHILFQNDILKKEYSKYGLSFSINQKVIDKELGEYQGADFISIPSNFVKGTFIEKGFSEGKLLLNPYGVNIGNFGNDQVITTGNEKLKLVYLGSMSFRKGIPYLIEALKNLENRVQNYEVHFIGSISDDFAPFFNANKELDWIFHGHIRHHKLKDKLVEFDLAIHPSLEEGLSMVLAQLLASGLPVIATTNTGGLEFIKDGFNGYIIPIRNSEAIKNKIELLCSDRILLNTLKENARQSIKNGFTWDDYGKRWNDNLQLINTI